MSPYCAASWLHHHQPHRASWVRLRTSSTGTCLQRDSFHCLLIECSHRGLMPHVCKQAQHMPLSVWKRFSSVHVWRAGCLIVGYNDLLQKPTTTTSWWWYDSYSLWHSWSLPVLASPHLQNSMFTFLVRCQRSHQFSSVFAPPAWTVADEKQPQTNEYTVVCCKEADNYYKLMMMKIVSLWILYLQHSVISTTDGLSAGSWTTLLSVVVGCLLAAAAATSSFLLLSNFRSSSNSFPLCVTVLSFVYYHRW